MPEWKYRSQMMVVPEAIRERMVEANSQRLALKRRWIAWSGRCVVEVRYELMVWPIGVVLSANSFSIQ